MYEERKTPNKLHRKTADESLNVIEFDDLGYIQDITPVRDRLTKNNSSRINVPSSGSGEEEEVNGEFSDENIQRVNWD